MMKQIPLDTLDALGMAYATYPILKGLIERDETMLYGDLAKEIGLVNNSIGWQVWHRGYISDILCIVAAVGRQRKEWTTDEEVIAAFAHFVNTKGENGGGLVRRTRIVRD
jgi:hypothetical protein